MSYTYSCCILLGTTDADKHKQFKDKDTYDLWTHLPTRQPLFNADEVQPAEAADCFAWMADPAPHYYWKITGSFRNSFPVTDILLRLRLAQKDGWHYALDYQGEDEWEPMVRGENYTSTCIINGVGQLLYHRFNPKHRKQQREEDSRNAKTQLCAQTEVLVDVFEDSEAATSRAQDKIIKTLADNGMPAFVHMIENATKAQRDLSWKDQF